MQADAGAQAVQIFDSWASNLAPQDYDIFAGPYINQIVDSVKQKHPDLPLILYISGSGGLLERMAKCNVEVISIDGSVDMKDAIRRVGPNFAVQVCPDLGRSQVVCKVSSALLRLQILFLNICLVQSLVPLSLLAVTPRPVLSHDISATID